MQVSPDDNINGNTSQGNQTSFQADDLEITYNWYQKLGRDFPTLCNVFFYVQGFNQVSLVYNIELQLKFGIATKVIRKLKQQQYIPLLSTAHSPNSVHFFMQ